MIATTTTRPQSPRTPFDDLRRDLRRAPRTWLVTGAAGFIGSSLVEALLELGQKVVALDDFSTGRKGNLDEARARTLAHGGTLRLVLGDVRRMDVCRSVCRGVDHVLHQAALASVPLSLSDPVRAHRANVDGTLHVFMAAAAEGVRVVYASSSAVYGDARALPLREEDAGSCLSPYALGKWMAEEYAALLGSTHGLDAVGLRYFNVVGPRQDPAGAYAAVVPAWTGCLLEGRPCTVHGDGSTTRDFVPVEDVVQANLLAATAPLSGSDPRVFNVGSGRRTSLLQLHDALAAAMRRQRPGAATPPPVHQGFRPGDVRHSHASVERIRRVLGYQPADALDGCLDEVVAARGRSRAAPLARAS